MMLSLVWQAMVFAGAMTASPGSGAGSIPFTVLAQGARSGIADERTMVILDQPTFHDLWASHVAVFVPPPSPPEVNFAGEMVIAAFAGARSTAGYRLGVARIEERDRRIHVALVLNRPGEDCLTAQVVTQPHVWVKIRRSALPVEFQTSTVDIPCRQGE